MPENEPQPDSKASPARGKMIRLIFPRGATGAEAHAMIQEALEEARSPSSPPEEPKP